MKLKIVSNPYGIVVGLLAGLLAIQFYIQYKQGEPYDVLSYVTLSIAILSAIFKGFASLIASLWMALGTLLGKVNGAILLTLVYFIILTPLSWLKQLISPSEVFSSKKEKTSRFIERNHSYIKGDLQFPW